MSNIITSHVHERKTFVCLQKNECKLVLPVRKKKQIYWNVCSGTRESPWISL